MKTIMKTLFLLVALTAAVPVFAQSDFESTKARAEISWVIHNISGDRQTYFYYDSGSVEKLDDVIKVSELLNYPNSTAQSRSTILTNYYDCQSKSIKSYRLENYKGLMGTGDLLRQETDEKATWEKITNPTSIRNNILNILCGVTDYRSDFIESFVESCTANQLAGVASTGFELSVDVISRYCLCSADYIYSAAGENVMREVELGVRQVSVLTALNGPASNYCANRL
jgi:hypothetical protein